MIDNFDEEERVSKDYLTLRERVLKYTNEDMNLKLDNDRQVYIAVFDIPMQSGIIGNQTQTLSMIFGLNTHIYHGSGSYLINLEQNPQVKKAMQSLLISSHQALDQMEMTDNIEFYNSDYVRVYLKTGKGTYFKELNEKGKVDGFLTMLMNNVLMEISKAQQ